MAAVLTKIIDRPIRHVEISEAEQGEIFSRMGAPKYAVDGLVETYSLVRAGRFGYLTNDVEKVTGESQTALNYGRINISPHSFEQIQFCYQKL